MLWTAEAVEDLKRLALAGKKRKPYRRGARRGSRNAVIGKASRSESSSAAAAGAPQRPARRQRARLGPNGRRLVTLGPMPTTKARQVHARRGLTPVEGRAGGLPLRRTRDRRDATAAVRGDSRIRLPLAARRSEKRRFRLLRADVGEGQSYCAGHCRLAYRPAQARRSRGSGRGCAPLGIRGGWPETARGRLRLLEYADQSRRIRARFAPESTPIG